MALTIGLDSDRFGRYRSIETDPNTKAKGGPLVVISVDSRPQVRRPTQEDSMAVMYVDARQEGIESLPPGGEVTLKFVVSNNVIILGDAVSHWDLALVALRTKSRFHAEPLTPDLVRHLVALHHITSAGKVSADGAVAFSTDSCYADFGLIPDPAERGRVAEAIRLALTRIPPAITWPTWRDAIARA